MPQNPTGNPVFDFQAEHRVRAAKIQKYATLAGLSLFTVGCGGVLIANTSERLRLILAGVALLGALLFAAGLAWGFHWRKKLQRDFRDTYGTENPQ
jgi:hypothetical protein